MLKCQKPTLLFHANYFKFMLLYFMQRSTMFLALTEAFVKTFTTLAVSHVIFFPPSSSPLLIQAFMIKWSGTCFTFLKVYCYEGYNLLSHQLASLLLSGADLHAKKKKKSSWFPDCEVNINVSSRGPIMRSRGGICNKTEQKWVCQTPPFPVQVKENGSHLLVIVFMGEGEGWDPSGLPPPSCS